MAHLKKRLGQAGVDLSNPRLNESFVLIGTPLPPLDKTKDANEFVPLWKQEVRDEQGRRRLHGAFTGGFSAGYFNTVGSKEGWTPSTFKSSRNDRNKGKTMRPEDFMDDEDRAEMQESRKLVDMDEVAESHRGHGMAVDETDTITAALANMLPPVNESIGAQLLKKMGWKPGQGIGPRLTYEQLKRRSEQDGTPLPAVDDAEAVKHTYAPRDTKLLTVVRKDDFHGLGYTPAGSLRASQTASTSSGPRISAGFGLGALNEADEDDLDVYDSGLTSGSRRLAFEAGEEDEDDRKPSKADAQGRPKVQSAGFFKNGAPLLGGFVVAEVPVPAPPTFEPPVVPQSWNPDPNLVWNSESAPPTGNEPISHQEWKKGVSADERGKILGETPLPTATRSIWDYISAKDRERIQGIKENKDGGSQPTAPPPVYIVKVPPIEPATAKAALLGFQPFKDDPAKQSRYTAYLKAQASSSAIDLQAAPGQSIEDFNNELESFAKAAQIFKPMSAAMQSRFRTSSTIEVAKKQQEGLYQPTDEAYAAHETKAEQDTKMEVEETPKQHAAKMGMFGAMTREQTDWLPMKLLCKRFRVPQPKIAAAEEVADDSSASNLYGASVEQEPVSMEVETSSASNAIRVVAAGEGTEDGGKRDLTNIGLGEDDTQGRDTLTYERPGMDIFKAIFASDEENSDNEEENVDINDLARPPVEANTKPRPAMQIVEPVDLSTFKPVFVSRSGRDPKREDGEKKTKKKSKPQPTMSFMDDDEGGLTVIPTAKKRKRDKDGDAKSSKKRKDKDEAKSTSKAPVTTYEEDDDEMWVEKEIVPAPRVAPKPPDMPSRVETTNRRPKAADFL